MHKTVPTLIKEVAEIEALIDQWRHDRNPEVQWAIQLLQSSLERRRERLRRQLH